MRDARRVWDVDARRWTTMGALGSCCAGCDHTSPGELTPCQRKAMGDVTDNTRAISSIACEFGKAQAPFLVATAALGGAALGALAGAVAQDKGKRMKGAAWGAGTGAIVGTALTGLSILTTCWGASAK